MNRDTLITLLDHGPSAVVYVVAGIGGVVASIIGQPEAATALFTFLGGFGLKQVVGGAANTLKKGAGE